MSFLGLGGSSSAAGGNVNPATMDIAVAELEMITDVFNRVVR
jgi:mitochondrial import inner membrane translocase subunit TIM10